MTSKMESVSAVKPFDLLPGGELSELVKELQVKKFESELVLYYQHYSKLKGVDILIKGEYEEFFYDQENEKKRIEYSRPGSVYGGISLLVNKKRSIRTVIVKPGTEIYHLPKSYF